MRKGRRPARIMPEPSKERESPQQEARRTAKPPAMRRPPSKVHLLMLMTRPVYAPFGSG